MRHQQPRAKKGGRFESHRLKGKNRDQSERYEDLNALSRSHGYTAATASHKLPPPETHQQQLDQIGAYASAFHRISLSIDIPTAVYDVAADVVDYLAMFPRAYHPRDHVLRGNLETSHGYKNPGTLKFNPQDTAHILFERYLNSAPDHRHRFKSARKIFNEATRRPEGYAELVTREKEFSPAKIADVITKCPFMTDIVQEIIDDFVQVRKVVKLTGATERIRDQQKAELGPSLFGFIKAVLATWIYALRAKPHARHLQTHPPAKYGSPLTVRHRSKFERTSSEFQLGIMVLSDVAADVELPLFGIVGRALPINDLASRRASGSDWSVAVSSSVQTSPQGDRTWVDDGEAQLYGALARANHASPGANTATYRVDSAPQVVAMLTCKAISAWEELTWEYSADYDL